MTRNPVLAILLFLISHFYAIGNSVYAQNLGILAIEIIDERPEIRNKVVRRTEEALLIVRSRLAEMYFESNNQILRVDARGEGVWHIFVLPGTHLLTFKSPGSLSVQERLYFRPKAVRGVFVSREDPPANEQYSPFEDTGGMIRLRDKARETLCEDEIRAIVRQYDFYAADWNPNGRGIDNRFETRGETVIDHRTGLIWQSSGSVKWISHSKIDKYLKRLQKEKFSGYDDWRLPTLEEAMSLMEPKARNGELHVSSHFAQVQRWIWTADQCNVLRERTLLFFKKTVRVVWVVNFQEGRYSAFQPDGKTYGYFVRAVRGGKSPKNQPPGRN